MNIKTQAVKDFLNRDFKSFSTYDCVINLPSLIDGFKVSQRKVMYTMLSRNKKVKVEQFANAAADLTHYKHGASNLEGVIVGLSQDFTGSNNINFLSPQGQFGNILNHSAAPGRYIFVEPTPNFRKWFKKEDDCILQYEYEDGEQIEPTYYIPIVPTLLFNGSSGIGTGYSCKVLSYNPKDVLDNVKRALTNKPLKKMVPWYNGYKGKITKDESQTIYTGSFERVNSTTLRITSLPIGYELEAYKNELAKLIDKDKIKDYDDNSTDEKWNILVYSNRAWIAQNDSELLDQLKLVSKDSENITVWDENKKIKIFESPEALIEYFVKWRLGIYEVRKQKQIDILTNDLNWAKEKIYFIKFYIDNAVWFSKNSKKNIEEKLKSEKFVHIDNLLSIKVYNLTYESIQKLKEEILKLNNDINELKKTESLEIYLKELG